MPWHESCKGLAGMIDPTSPRYEQYLDLLAQRQKLSAANIANLDTPGYRTKDIDFQFEFMSAMDADPAAKGAAPARVIEPTNLTVKNDGNNVSLDREARLLAENALRFNFVSNLLKGEMRMLKKAIDEGRSA
jgi:flagellar basal-body rod protein FlgB